jgi:hypothetical protein
MRAAAFVRYNGADGMGHVGWAFDFSEDLTDCGGVEDPRGLPSSDPADMGFWTQSTTTPVAVMASHAPVYDALKYVDLAEGDPRGANATVLWVAEQPYTLFGRNCMDDVYDVLRSYGVRNLPPPVLHWFPNNWFAAFGGTSEPMSFAWRPERPAPGVQLLEELTVGAPAEVPAEVVKSAHAEITPSAPPWRVAGTPEWHDLQAQMAATSGIPSIRARGRNAMASR